MRIEREVFEDVKRHCESEYPHEGCGVLGGRDGLVTHSIPVKNAAKDRGFDIYEMDPMDQLRAFEKVDEMGLERLGFYHSHPDHEAYFSETDRDNALLDGEPMYPGETHLVLSIVKGEYREAKAFAWESGFVEVGLEGRKG